MSTFGHLYRVHTYGESHCKSVGCIIDGVPPVGSTSSGSPSPAKNIVTQGLKITEEDIQIQLSRRRPGQSDITTAVCPSLPAPASSDENVCS